MKASLGGKVAIGITLICIALLASGAQWARQLGYLLAALLLYLTIYFKTFHGMLKSQNGKLEGAWRQVGRQAGLELNEGDAGGLFHAARDPGLSGLYRGRRISAWSQAYIKDAEDVPSYQYTHIAVQLDDPGNCQLALKPKGMRSIGSSISAILSGQKGFDRRYECEGQPDDFVRRAKQLMLQQAFLMEAPIQLSPSIEVQGSDLVYTQFAGPPQLPDPLSLLNLLCVLAELVGKYSYAPVQDLQARPIPWIWTRQKH
jgi:hypothetical protein